jgi:hypothetical protein
MPPGKATTTVHPYHTVAVNPQMQVGRFTFTIESRCVIAAAARARRMAAFLQPGGIKDAQN